MTRRDWPKILADLRAAGYLTYKISCRVQAKWDTVKRWELGLAEPRHSDGELILEMYREVFRRTADAQVDGLP